MRQHIDRALRPLTGSFEQTGYPGVYLDQHGRHAKVFNSLRNSAGQRFTTIEEALSHAVFYSALREEGFFHPKTAFIVSKDSTGEPTVVCIMPRISLKAPTFRERFALKQKVSNVLSRYLLRKEVPELHFDLDVKENYGRFRGKAYFLDLHLLARNPSEAVSRWYKLWKAANRNMKPGSKKRK